MSQPVQDPVPASRARWLSTALVPIKQHVLCCGVTKLLVSAGVVGAGASEVMESLPGQVATVLVAAPIVTYGVMRGEEWWHQRRHAHDAEHHCARPPLTLRRYFRETAISIGFGAIASLGAGLLWPHEHHHEEHGPAKTEKARPAAAAHGFT